MDREGKVKGRKERDGRRGGGREGEIERRRAGRAELGEGEEKRKRKEKGRQSG